MSVSTGRCHDKVVEKHSPGMRTEYTMAYLSTKHLTEHNDQPSPYSEEAVKHAKKDKSLNWPAFVDTKLAERLTDLLHDVSTCETSPCDQACNC